MTKPLDIVILIYYTSLKYKTGEKMTQIKYKTPNVVDANQTRIHAMLVVLLMSAYLLMGSTIFLYILLYDFFVRIYVASLLSPLYLISTTIVNLIPAEQKFADGYAKEFASHIGLSVLFITLLAELVGGRHTAVVLILFFIVWKIFEATKDICFACELYELLKCKNIEVVSL